MTSTNSSLERHPSKDSKENILIQDSAEVPVEPVIKKRGKGLEYNFNKVVGEEIVKRNNHMSNLRLTDQNLIDKTFEIIKENNNQTDYGEMTEDLIQARNMKAVIISNIL